MDNGLLYGVAGVLLSPSFSSGTFSVVVACLAAWFAVHGIVIQRHILTFPSVVVSLLTKTMSFSNETSIDILPGYGGLSLRQPCAHVCCG